MPAAAKEEMLASPSTEEIFSLAATVAAALETREGEHAARGKKPHQGIFPENHRPRIGSTWLKWSGTHQDRSLAWSETMLGPTIYLYDGMDPKANATEEIDNGGNALARYTESDLVDEPLAELRGTTTSYYEADALGSVISLSNSNAGLTNSYVYDSFGNVTASTGTLTNPFQFTARDADSESGLYYYRARYYAPQIGRFLSEDPIRFEGGIDFFAYVHNNPARFKDSSGLLGIDSSCDCGGFDKNNVQNAAQQALAAAARITDSGLRDCIIDHLNKGKVECGNGSYCHQGKPDKNGRITLGWSMPWGSTIHLCKAVNGADPRMACIMIHEFAHTCHHMFEGTPDRAMNQAFPGQCPQ
jgi:RHS repeat-associated protein